MATAKNSWNNLGLASVQERLDAIGTVVGNHLISAVSGLTQQALTESHRLAPRIENSLMLDLEDAESETSSRTMEEKEEALDLQSIEGAKISNKLRGNTNDKQEKKHSRTQKINMSNCQATRTTLV